MRVKDLRVLITGAASGAGRTIAEMLADADARVFVSDISDVSVAALSNARSDIRVVQADAGNEAEICSSRMVAGGASSALRVRPDIPGAEPSRLKALGLTVSPAVLARADEVIE